MKISKTTQWILIIGIFAILIIAAGVAYGRQMAAQSRLNSELVQAQQDFIKYTERKRDLETKLSQAQFSMASVQNEFRRYTESIEIDEALFDAADDANVTITELRSVGTEDEELNGIIYSVSSIRITAKGQVAALLNFSQKISDRFSAATVVTVEVRVPKAAEDDGGAKPTIELWVKIYVYESR